MTAKSILFLDQTCFKPYSPETLRTQGLNGTEATVVRVAERLSQWYAVLVAQHNRTDDLVGKFGAVYLSMGGLDRAAATRPPDIVVTIRKPKEVLNAHRRFPTARLILWMHHIPTRHYRRHRAMLVRRRCTVVMVSEFAKAELTQCLRSPWLGPIGQLIDRAFPRPLPRIERIYEAIDDDLEPDQTAIDADKLVFFSSPHKGLDQVLLAFQAVRQRRPSARLYVANPGYLADMALDPNLQGVTILGSLPQQEVLRHVRQAFCVFYPQTTFPEAFGLVFAEANAVGTPVMAHPLGAAAEVLCNSEQLVDSSDPQRVADALMRWYEGGRPRAGPGRSIV